MKSTDQNKTLSQQVVYFDDTCKLCNDMVSSLKKYDKSKILEFQPLRFSEYKHLNNIVFKDQANLYNKTDAVLKIVTLLKIHKPLQILLKLAPRKIRDWVYDLIARNRNKFFATN